MNIIVRCTGLAPVEIEGLEDLDEAVEAAVTLSKATGASIHGIEIVRGSATIEP